MSAGALGGAHERASVHVHVERMAASRRMQRIDGPDPPRGTDGEFSFFLFQLEEKHDFYSPIILGDS